MSRDPGDDANRPRRRGSRCRRIEPCAGASPFLNCPCCGLSIRTKAWWSTIEYCPRCIARKRPLQAIYTLQLAGHQLGGGPSDSFASAPFGGMSSFRGHAAARPAARRVAGACAADARIARSRTRASLVGVRWVERLGLGWLGFMREVSGSIGCDRSSDALTRHRGRLRDLLRTRRWRQESVLRPPASGAVRSRDATIPCAGRRARNRIAASR